MKRTLITLALTLSTLFVFGQENKYRHLTSDQKDKMIDSLFNQTVVINNRLEEMYIISNDLHTVINSYKTINEDIQNTLDQYKKKYDELSDELDKQFQINKKLWNIIKPE